MADAEKLDDAQEITDEMKEKLLLNLFGDSVKSKLAQPASATPDGQRRDGSQYEAGSGDASSPTSANAGAADAEVPNQTPSAEGTQSRGESAPGPIEESKPPVDSIAELEEKLKMVEADLNDEQLEDRHQRSQQLKGDANNLYKDSLYGDAVAKYSEALELCPLRETKSRSVLYANKAAALMGESNNKEALPYLDKAMELDPNYFKALERRARLNRILDNLDDSLKDYERLLEMKPKHCEYTASARELRERIRIRNEEMKTKMMDSLKQLGNVFLKPFGLSTENFNMVPNENGGYNLQMGGQQ